MNSMKPMLCNNKQTKNNQCSPPLPRPLTLANPPRVRPYLARAAGRIQWSTWQWGCTWPIAGPQTLFVRREHTDSFRGYNLFTSSMQQRHPRPSFMNCPYHALTGVLIIIMYIYHALINALSAHMIHINLNMIFYTHVEHSPTKTIYIKFY